MSSDQANAQAARPDAVRDRSRDRSGARRGWIGRDRQRPNERRRIDAQLLTRHRHEAGVSRQSRLSVKALRDARRRRAGSGVTAAAAVVMLRAHHLLAFDDVRLRHARGHRRQDKAQRKQSGYANTNDAHVLKDGFGSRQRQVRIP